MNNIQVTLKTDALLSDEICNKAILAALQKRFPTEPLRWPLFTTTVIRNAPTSTIMLEVIAEESNVNNADTEGAK